MGEKERNRKRKEKGKEMEKERKSKSNTAYIITALLAATAAINFYFFYMSFQTTELPKLDLEEWWGQTDRTLQNKAIRPFRIHFTDAMELQLRRKIDEHRLKKQPQSFQDTAWNYGVHSETLNNIISHWIFHYKFRERQNFLNQFDHFKTNVQGLDIHFLHVKPNNTGNLKVIPMILMHGWPGSIREFYEVIPILTNPKPEYDFVFEVVIPSLPGFGFSEATQKPGMSPVQAAVIMHNLMMRLGFQQYFIQGGDFGAAIGTHMSTLFPDEVLGFHTNFAMDASTVGIFETIVHAAWKSMWNGESFWEKIAFYIEESGYMHLQGTKPDTIGFALNQSPAGLLAYILDKWQVFTDLETRDLRDGGISRYYNTTDLLDNVMMYWAPGCITTSMRLYKESFDSDLEKIMATIPTAVPTWALKFKHEVVQQPNSILRRKFTNLLGSTKFNYGGHFAAFERPLEFSDDVFKSVGKFLEFHQSK